MGRQVIVDNRPGAGGAIGVELAAKSPPDGYTLLLMQNSITIQPSLSPNVPYDPVKDITAISKTASYEYYLVAHPSLPVRTVKQLIALAKARPGEINYATSGFGGGNHLAAELFNYMAGVKTTHVPYKGVAALLPDLISGGVSIHFGSTFFVPHVKARRLTALGVTGAKRSSALPDVPTIAESGLPGFEVTGWSGLFAPTGTADAIINRLNPLVKKAIEEPSARLAMEVQGLDPAPSSPSELSALVKKDLAMWAEVIKKAGLKADR